MKFKVGDKVKVKGEVVRVLEDSIEFRMKTKDIMWVFNENVKLVSRTYPIVVAPRPDSYPVGTLMVLQNEIGLFAVKKITSIGWRNLAVGSVKTFTYDEFTTGRRVMSITKPDA